MYSVLYELIGLYVYILWCDSGNREYNCRPICHQQSSNILMTLDSLSVLTTCQLVYPLSFTIVYVWRHVGQHPIKCWCGWYTSWHIRWLLGNKSANMSTDCPLTCQPSISRCVDQHVDWVSGDSDDWYSAEVPKFHKIWDIFFQTFLTWKKGAFLWNDQLTII